MSVPIVAATLADSLKPIMEEMVRSLDCRTLMVSMNADGTVCTYIHDGPGQCAQGLSRESISRALHDANNARQSREEAARRAA